MLNVLRNSSGGRRVVTPAHVAFIYLIFGALWILVTDVALAAVIQDREMLATFQTFKGWFYIIVTAFLLYLLVSVSVARVSASESRLAELEVQYRTLLDTMNEGVCVLDAQGRTVYVNEQICTLLGVDRETLLERGPFSLVTPECRQALDQLDDDDVQRVELRFRRPDGTIFTALVSHSVVHDDSGDKVVGSIRTILDINDLKRSQEQLRESYETQTRLLDELNHRVRNNLGSLLTLIDLTHGSTTELDEFASTMKDRVWGFSAAHSLLAQTRWAPVNLRVLIENVLQAEDRRRLSLEGPDVEIPPTKASPLAMALSELLTNARRHGALTSEGGRVRVGWTVRHEHDRRRLSIKWEEHLPEEREQGHRRGTGLTIVEGLIQSDLGGSMASEFAPGGVKHTITFEIRDSEAPEGRAPLAAAANGR